MKSRIYKINVTFKASKELFSILITKHGRNIAYNVFYFYLWFVSAIQKWVNFSFTQLCFWIWTLKCGPCVMENPAIAENMDKLEGDCLMESHYIMYIFIYSFNKHLFWARTNNTMVSKIFPQQSTHAHTHTKKLHIYLECLVEFPFLSYFTPVPV